MKKYNGYIDSVKAEFTERVFSSKKRVIKFIAICFVPFLYAFVCIWAFWNPIPKIGEAPMAIVSNDVPINFIAGRTTDDKLATGEAYYYLKAGESETKVIIDDSTDWDSIPYGSIFITTAGTKIVKSSSLMHSKISLMDKLVSAWKSGSVDNITYDSNRDKFSIRVSETMSLTNLTFLNGKAAQAVAEQKEDGSWKVKNENKYWAQIQMPTKFSSNIIGYFDASLQKRFKLPSIEDEAKNASDFITDLQKNSIHFWSTYKHNFLFGQFMYIFNHFKSSLLVDMGPQVISQLVSLIIQNYLDQIKNQLVFIAPESLTEEYKIIDHGSLISHKAVFKVTKGEKYVIRNKEMLDAIKTAHSDWKLPQMTVEGTTGNDISKDWQIDGYLSILAEQWNQLMNGKYGELIANNLATTITQKINNYLLTTKLGTLQINSAGVRELFSTAGNIAGFLEQDGSIIPETIHNFTINGTGLIAKKVTDYKKFVTVVAPILNKNFNLISILSPNSATSTSAYILPYGSLINPEKGTFNYNWHHDINVLLHLIFNQSVSDTEILKTAEIFDLDSFFPNLGDFFKTTIVGSQFNLYGIGLGQFFLCIGLWVGILMQTFVYDRAKRVKKAKPWAWYLSKTTLMMITAWIQTTVLMLTVYLLGWSVIGSAFGLLYLWMMFTATIFVLIEQALWFTMRDETIGKFFVILLLIINLSSGWGTFPTFMQAGIFNILSYIAPYTYSIHGQGFIIYSIAVNGANASDTLYLMQQFGILIIFGAIFTIIGLLTSILRTWEMYYGTHNSKHLGQVLISVKLIKYVNPKNNKANWKKLPKEEMPQLRKEVLKMYPEEKQFAWFKSWKAKNNPDKPLTASDSDDEIMKRND